MAKKPTSLAKDDFAADATTTGEVKPEQILRGNIETAGDTDWIKVQMKPGLNHIFVSGASTGNGTLKDPAVTIVDKDGKTVPSSTDNFGVGGNETKQVSIFEDGTYYVKVSSADPKATGSYSVVSRLAKTDDDASTGSRLERMQKTKRILKDGQTVSDRTDISYDVDPFKLDLVAGRKYTFTTSPDSSKAAAMYGSNMFLYDSAGKEIARTNNDKTGNKLTFTAKASGTYYMSVTGGLYRYGDYKVSMKSELVTPTKPKDDIAGDASTKTSAKIGQVVSGNIETAGDQDWIKVRLEQGKAYDFRAAGAATGNGTLKDPGLELVDKNGKRLDWNGADWGKGTNEMKSYYNWQATGDYYLRVKSGDAKGVGTYQVNFRESNRNDGDATVRDMNNYLFEGDSAKGTITSGDVDRFQSYLTKGRQYSFTVEADNSKAGGLANNARLRVFDENFKEVPATIKTVDGKSTVTFVAGASKYHYFEVRGKSAYAAQGDYKVALTGNVAPAPKPMSLLTAAGNLRSGSAGDGSGAAEKGQNRLVAATAPAAKEEAKAPQSAKPLSKIASGLGCSASAPSGALKTASKRKSGASGLAAA